MLLMAIVRPMVGSWALYTTPIAPRPNSPTIWYRPICCTWIISFYSSGNHARAFTLPPPQPHIAAIGLDPQRRAASIDGSVKPLDARTPGAHHHRKIGVKIAMTAHIRLQIKSRRARHREIDHAP